jgi:NAD(P)-dependent dehydrogenase (short-subunit alcohol dehydrogenase family)
MKGADGAVSDDVWEKHVRRPVQRLEPFALCRGGLKADDLSPSGFDQRAIDIIHADRQRADVDDLEGTDGLREKIENVEHLRASTRRQLHVAVAWLMIRCTEQGYKFDWVRVMRLKDKVIIVTGSTTGIGEAMARRFVAEGARVLVHGLERELGEAVVRELGPGSAALHIDDLADPNAVPRVIHAAVSAFGRIDTLVNNAAWIIRSNIQTTDLALFDRCIAINTRAPLLLIKAALPHLKESQGCVVNIGSVNGFCGEPTQLAYSISKGALMTLSRNLADALGRERVRVNHLNLGWVLSANEYKLKISEGLPSDWPEHPPAGNAPSGRLIMPEQIAAAAVYWAGDESRPISGTVLELEQFPFVGRNPLKK